MLLNDLVALSSRIAGTSSRNQKVERLAAGIAEAEPGEVPLVVSYLSGELPQGRIGVGPASLEEAIPGSAADRPALEVVEVDDTFARIADASGPGSTAERVRLLRALLLGSTAEEQRFLARLLSGELRQGAQEGIMLSAIARAAGVRLSRIRRAHLLTGDPARVAVVAMAHGAAGLAELRLRVFRPLRPMLAQSADSVAAAVAGRGPAIMDQKLDGARIQVHRRGGEVRIFSRALKEVTPAVPEVVELVLDLDVDEVVLDGEALALRPDGTPEPFQTTMSRFGRTRDVPGARERTPLTPFFFDILHLDGETLLDRPLTDRLARLDRVVPEEIRVLRRSVEGVDDGEAFLAKVREAGHEGVMVKDPGSTYQAGRRGKHWVKVKPVHTLDLVVLAAEWGHGRRKGWLSNLHLGARDSDGGFVMLGKTFKGMTDEILERQTRQLLALERERRGRTVHVRPELVVEIAFNDVQASPRYPGGVALRFARLKGYRPDKTADDVDTIETVRRIHRGGDGAP